MRGVADGDATIKARTVNGKEAKVKVKVVDKTKPTKVSLSVEGSYTWDGDRRVIKKGEGVQLRATLSPGNAVTNLEWKSSSTKRATVTGSGWVTAVGEGDFEIEVKTTREGKKDKLKFKVIDQPKKVSIENDKTIKVGQTLQLTAEVEPKGTDPSVTWSSTDTSIATVDGSGKVTGKKKGKVKIKVKTVNGKTDTVKIKVEN